MSIHEHSFTGTSWWSNTPTHHNKTTMCDHLDCLMVLHSDPTPHVYDDRRLVCKVCYLDFSCEPTTETPGVTNAGLTKDTELSPCERCDNPIHGRAHCTHGACVLRAHDFELNQGSQCTRCHGQCLHQEGFTCIPGAYTVDPTDYKKCGTEWRCKTCNLSKNETSPHVWIWKWVKKDDKDCSRIYKCSKCGVTGTNPIEYQYEYTTSPHSFRPSTGACVGCEYKPPTCPHVFVTTQQESLMWYKMVDDHRCLATVTCRLCNEVQTKESDHVFNKMGDCVLCAYKRTCLHRFVTQPGVKNLPNTRFSDLKCVEIEVCSLCEEVKDKLLVDHIWVHKPTSDTLPKTQYVPVFPHKN